MITDPERVEFDNECLRTRMPLRLRKHRGQGFTRYLIRIWSSNSAFAFKKVSGVFPPCSVL